MRYCIGPATSASVTACQRTSSAPDRAAGRAGPRQAGDLEPHRGQPLLLQIRRTACGGPGDRGLSQTCHMTWSRDQPAHTFTPSSGSSTSVVKSDATQPRISDRWTIHLPIRRRPTSRSAGMVETLPTIPRMIEQPLTEMLCFSRVVAVVGPRQAGKSTLARRPQAAGTVPACYRWTRHRREPRRSRTLTGSSSRGRGD